MAPRRRLKCLPLRTPPDSCRTFPACTALRPAWTICTKFCAGGRRAVCSSAKGCSITPLARAGRRGCSWWPKWPIRACASAWTTFSSAPAPTTPSTAPTTSAPCKCRSPLHAPAPYSPSPPPSHLGGLEVPLPCARAVLYGRADMAPIAKPTAEVCAVAKRDLYPGGRLDAIGEYTYRAWAMTVADARRQRAVPCGLLEQGTVLQPIRKGELLTYANSAVDAGSRIVELRRRQDELIHGKQGAAA